MQNKFLFSLGYRSFHVEGMELKNVLSLLRKEKITARVSASAQICVPFYLWRKTKKILGDKVVFIDHKIGGAASLFYSALGHLGAIAAIGVFLLFYLLLSGYVFDVRIEGNEISTEQTMIEEIAKGGLYSGVRWSDVDTSTLENRILSLSDEIAWVNINRRGLVAYVSLRERESGTTPQKPSGYANIVSRYEGVVEDITVESGSAAVKVGETVKRGDLLISAFDASGNPVYADGAVSARVYGEISVFVPRVEEVCTEKEYRIIEKNINIFNFSAKIFKNYRNLPKEYDIIKDERQVLLAGGKALPIRLITEYAVIDHTEKLQRTDEELLSLAKRAHESALLSYLADAELISIRTSTSLTDAGYTVRSQICMLKEIGEAIPLAP